MPKIDSGLTISTPILLIALALLALILRCLLVTEELKHPQSLTYQIAWNTPTDKKPITDKPILYVFTAPWSGACKNLESNCFANKNIVNQIDACFYPMRVEDQSMTKHYNLPEVQKLEEEYGAVIFPMMVVVLPPDEFGKTDDIVDRTFGQVKYSDVKKFLDNTLKLIPYFQGRICFSRGQFAEAETKFAKYLEKNGWSDEKAAMANVRRYYCLKFLQKDAEALALLNTAVEKLPKDKWPYPLLKHIQGANSHEELKKLAGDSMQKRIEYHTYLGLSNYLNNKTDQAKIDLKWVTTQEQYKRWTEYKLAASVLQRIAKKDLTEK